MAGIVAGSSLGVLQSSLALLGAQGQLGNAASGRSGERVFLNAATGNLVLQDQDEFLAGRGPDAALLRTYNSQGLLDDDNGDNWRIGLYRRVSGLTGTVGTAGSTITRTDADGAQAVYTFNTTLQKYVTTEGDGAYDTLSYNSGAQTWTWTDGDTGNVETYDNANGGRLTQLADTSGNAVTLTYTGALLTAVHSASGETTYLDYTGNNLTQLRTVTSGGATLVRTRYAYDASNRLVTVTTDLSPQDASVADGKTYVTSYTYDGTSRRVATITQSDGTSLAFQYVQVGADYRVSQITDALGHVTAVSYNTTARTTTVTDPLGRATVLAYDTSNRLTGVTLPAVNGVSQQVSYAYDGSGNVASVTDARGDTVVYGYDANGNRNYARDAAGNVVQRVYDTANRNQLLAETLYVVPDPDGAGAGQPGTPLTTRYVYDANRRLRFAVSAEGRVTEYRYDGFGQRVAAIQYTAAKYDVSTLAPTATLTEAQLTAWLPADRSQSTRVDTAYDFRGQVASTTTYAAVDSAGNGVANGSQSVAQYVYDQAGNLLQTVDPRGAAIQTTYAYDGLGRVVSTTDAAGNVTLTAYQDSTHKTVVTLANGLVRTSTYDTAGELVSVAESSGGTTLGTTSYFYDADGRLRRTEDPTGVKTHLLYDEAGRKVAEIDGTGALTEFRYDAANNLTRTLRYANLVSATALASLSDAQGMPQNVSLASIRPAASGGDRSTWNAYDAANRLVKTVDAAGFVAQSSYDGAGRLVGVTAFATAIATTSLGDTPAASAIAPAASASADRTTRTFYDAEGRLLGKLDGEGGLTEYKYDASGALVETVAYATATTASLRAAGTLDQLRPTAASGDIHGYVLYNARGQQVGAVDGEGYLTESVYDAAGNKTQSIRYATRVAYTAGATLAGLRPASSAADQATSYAYDNLDRVTSSTSPDGTVTQYTYDNAGNLTRTVKAANTADARTLNAQYDKQGRLTAELSGVGSALLTGNLTQAQIDAIWSQYATHYTYDAAGRRASATDPQGNRTVFYYDADGRLAYTINSLGEVKQSSYDALGQLVRSVRYGQRLTAGTAASLAGGLVDATVTGVVGGIADTLRDSVVTYVYDTRGDLAQSTDALGFSKTSTFDAFGEAVTSSQQIAAGQTLDHTYAYDRRGLLTQTVWDPSGVNASAATQYDAFGRAVQTTDARGNVRASAYDKLGRVVATTDPLNASRSTTYDAFGRVLTRTDALGNTTTYAYDTAARSVTVTTPEGVATTTVYDREGDKISVTDGRGNTTSYQYDADGNLVAVDAAGTGTTTSSYDRADRLIQTVDGRGVATSYTYDAAGRVLTRVVDPGGLALTTSYGYDSAGHAVSVIDANGVETRTDFDLAGQAVSVIVDPNGLRLKTSYTYDGLGDKLTVVEGAGSPQQRTTQYAYDKLGRLTSQRVDPAGLNLTTTFAYDKNGNVAAKTDANGNATRYAYDADDRRVYTVDPLGGVTKTEYDAEGRVVRSTAYANAINAAALPAVPTLSDIVVTADAARDRVSATVYDRDGRERFLVDPLGAVLEKGYNSAGFVTRTVAYANRIPLGTALTVSAVQAALVPSAGDETTRTFYDAVNRPVYTVDANGTVTGMHYDENGNLQRSRVYATPVALAPNAVKSDLEAALDANIATAGQDRVQRYVYDAANRQVYAIDAANTVKETRYDNLGRVTQTVQYAQAIDVGALPTLAEVQAALAANGASGSVAGAYANQTVYSGEFTGQLAQPYTYVASAKADTATATPQSVTVSVSNATQFQSASIASNAWARSGTTLVQVAGISVVPGTVARGDNTPTQVRATVYRVSDGVQVAQTYTDVGFSSTETWSVPIAWDEYGNPIAYRTASGTRWNNVGNYSGQANITTGTLPAGHYKIVLEAWDSAQAARAEGAFYDLTDGTWYTTNTLNDVVIGTIAQPTVVSWAGATQPAGTASVSFQYRTSGSTGAYTSATVTTNGTSQQVSLSGLANGNYEYVIQYKDSYGRVLKSSNGTFTSTQGGSSSVAATFTYTTYGSSAVAGSSIRYFSQAADWQPVDHVSATVRDQNGNVVSTALTYPEAEASYNGEVNLKTGAALADGRYSVELTIYNKNGTTTTVAPFLYELGQQRYATRTTTVTWSAATQPAGTTVEFAYTRAGQSGETLVTPTLADGVYSASFTYSNNGGIETGIADGIYSYTVRYKQSGTVVSQAKGEFVAAAGEHGQFTLDFTSATALERVNTFAYDRAGRLIQSTDALGFSESYAYDALGNKTSFTNKKGATWNYGYDAAGRLSDEYDPAVAVTSSAGAVEAGVSLRTHMQYDGLGNVVARTEAYGRAEARTTQYQYDAAGHQVKTIFPTVGVYDASLDNLATNTGAIYRAESAQALYSQVTYDALGRAVVNRATDGTYSYKVYDGAGRVLYDIDAESYVSEYRYDAFGNQTATIRYANRLAFGSHPAGTAWSATAVAAALATSGADRRIDKSYDVMNRVVEVVEPQAYVYDALNNAGALAAKRTRYEYDAFGELVRQRALASVDATGAPASWADTYSYYDARGQRIAQVDAEGYLTQWQYDGAGEMTRQVEFAKRVPAWSTGNYQAPAAGDAVSGFDRTTTYAYDLDGRKTSETRVGVHFSQLSGTTGAVDATGDVTTTFGYDALGNRVSTTDAAGATTYTYYDALGRIVAVAAPARQLTDASHGGATVVPLTTFGVDAFGKTVRQTEYANGAASATASGFTAGAASPADEVASTFYDAHGNAIQTTDGEGHSKYFSYDAAGRVAKSWEQAGEYLSGGTLTTENVVHTYRYDALGNQIATVDSSTPVNYVDPAYPPLGNYQFSVSPSIAQSASATWGYYYDEYGNVTGSYLASWQPNNAVNVSWGVNLASLGSGQVKVTLGYNLATGGSTTRDFVFGGGVTTGATLSWADGSTSSYGVSSVNRVSIYKQDTSGTWRLLEDTSANGWSSTLVGWQPSTTGTVSLVTRPNATSAWTTASTWTFGAVTIADMRAAGSVQFEARHASTEAPAFAYEAGNIGGGAVGANTMLREEDASYDAFGEIVSKSSDGRQTQYAEYDNAGHLWRTNGKDGVDHVYLYDAQGQQTADIRSMSANLRSYADAAAADAATRSPTVGVRTETHRDLLERVTAQEMPAFGSIDPSVVHSPQVVSAGASYSVSHNGYLYTDEYGNPTFYGGTDYVNIGWASIAGWGGGNVHVQADVVTQFNGAMSLTADLGAATTGGSVGVGDLILSVSRVRVWKNDAAGHSVLIEDSANPNTKRLTFASPSTNQAGDTAVFSYAPTGTTNWTDVMPTNFGAISIVDPTWANGTYDYKVQYKHADGTVYATGTGTLVLSGTSATVTATSSDTQVVVPLVQQTLDRWGNTLTMVDPRFNGDPATLAQWQATYRYDEQNHLLSEKKPQILVQDENGGIRTVQPETRNFYDLLGRAIGVQDANAVDRDTNANGIYEGLTTATYNAAGQLVRQIRSDGGVTSFSYDALGRQVGQWDARGYFTGKAYDRDDRLTQTTQPDGTTQQYEYDELGNRRRVKDGRGYWTIYAYDANGNVVRQSLPNGQTTWTYYDHLGRKTREVNANGDAQAWQYDMQGRVTAYTDLSGTTASYTYNGLGQVATAVSGRAQDTYTYDLNGSLKHIHNVALSADQSTWWTEETDYQYDAAGNRTHETVSERGVVYQDSQITYDALNRITDVTDLRYHLTYTYDANGNRRHTTASYFDSVGNQQAKSYWYKYDSENRIVLSQGVLSGNQIVVDPIVAKQGTALTYDAAGNRTSANGVSTGNVNETYIYDSNGRLQEINRNGVIASYRYYDGAGNMTQRNTYDGGGVLSGYQVNSYDANGWLTHQTNYVHVTYTDELGNGYSTYSPSTDISFSRTGTGQVSSYTVGAYAPSYSDSSYTDESGAYHLNVNFVSGWQYTNTYSYSYARYGDSYKEAVQSGSSTYFQPGSTVTRYDGNGNIYDVNDTFNGSGYRTFVTDRAGHILQKTQNGQNEYYFYADDKPLASVGTNGAADFDFNYTPVSDDYPASTPANYTVNSGDTLRGIAQAVYGDAGLWYLIADANGISSDSQLKVGMSLTIPNRITNLHNDATTFKPYDPSKIIGDTTPTLPDPPPPPDDGDDCGGFGEIIVMVVTIVVAIYAPELLPEMDAWMTAAATAAIVSTASQLTAMAVGLQNSFDFGAVVTAAATAGAGEFLGAANVAGQLGMEGTSAQIANAVIQNAATQGINIVLGRQDRFNWQSVAMAAVSAPVRSWASKTFGDAVKGDVFGDGRLAGNFAGNLATQAISNAFGNGGKMDFVSMAGDAFKNTYAKSYVQESENAGDQEEKLRQTILDNLDRQDAELGQTMREAEYAANQDQEDADLGQAMREAEYAANQDAEDADLGLAMRQAELSAAREQADEDAAHVLQEGGRMAQEGRLRGPSLAGGDPLPNGPVPSDGVEGAPADDGEGKVDPTKGPFGYKATRTAGDKADRWRTDNGRFAQSPFNYDPIAKDRGAEFKREGSVDIDLGNVVQGSTTVHFIEGEDNLLTANSSYQVGSKVVINNDGVTASAKAQTASELVLAKDNYDLAIAKGEVKVTSNVEANAGAELQLNGSGAKINAGIGAEAVALEADGKLKINPVSVGDVNVGAEVGGSLKAGAIGGKLQAFAEYENGRFSAGLGASASALVGASVNFKVNVDASKLVANLPDYASNSRYNPLAPVGQYVGGKIYDWLH